MSKNLGTEEKDAILAKFEILAPSHGFQLPAGWVGLLEDLIVDLLDLGWDKDLHQVKEKFGGLRFYTGPLTPEMQEVVTHYEGKSFKICHDCGSEDNVTQAKSFWITFLCDKCNGPKE